MFKKVDTFDLNNIKVNDCIELTIKEKKFNMIVCNVELSSIKCIINPKLIEVGEKIETNLLLNIFKYLLKGLEKNENKNSTTVSHFYECDIIDIAIEDIHNGNIKIKKINGDTNE